MPVNAVALARFLVGKTLVRDRPEAGCWARIVETEAYLPHDRACHAFNGQTKRNRSLFLEHGHTYVYFIYGNHFMLNVQRGARGRRRRGCYRRALEPLDGTMLDEETPRQGAASRSRAWTGTARAALRVYATGWRGCMRQRAVMAGNGAQSARRAHRQKRAHRYQQGCSPPVAFLTNAAIRSVSGPKSLRTEAGHGLGVLLCFPARKQYQ